LPLGLRLSPQDLQGEDAQLHFGLVDAADSLLACVVAVPQASGVFKLRQMAVREDQQGQGRGSCLLAEVEAVLQEQGATELRLHARVSAVPFYARQGYAVESEEFEEVGIPHRRMGKTLSA
jgi:predicted GNAT family N-acyltransferase